MAKVLRPYWALASILPLAAFGFAPAASAAPGGPPLGRVYDCYSNPTGSLLHYVDALELKSSSTYLVAPFRKGTQLSGRTASGTYKLSGSLATFLTGPYGQLRYSGKWQPKHTGIGGYVVGASLSLLNSHHVSTGISCYPH